MPPTRRVQEELDGAGVGVPDLARESHGTRRDQAAYVVADRGRRRLLEHLLVPALGRAVALVEVHDVAVVVGQHLHLDVAAVLDVLLDQDRVVAERRQRLALRGGDGLVEVLGPADDPHALATATGGGLHQDGVGDLGGRACRDPGRHDRHARLDRDLAGGVLAAHRVHHGGGRTHQPDPRSLQRGGEGGALGEEAVTRVYGVGAHSLARPPRSPRCPGSCRRAPRRRRPARAGRRGRCRCGSPRCAGRSRGRPGSRAARSRRGWR